MGFYDSKKKLDSALSEIFKKTPPNTKLDLKSLVAELSLQCSPLGEKSVLARIETFQNSGKIIIIGNTIEVVS